MGALALLFWVDLFMIPIYLVWTLANGELVEMFTVAFSTTSVTVSFTFTAALGGVRALTQYVVLVFVTATSMSTANIFTQILNILISIPLQGTTVTPALLAGIILVICCSASYAYLKMNKAVLKGIDEKMKRMLGMESAPPPKDYSCDWPDKPSDHVPNGMPRKRGL